ncbi:DUF2690 domain-containing protein [Streptomyces sp. NPDC052020]|uniref:helix-turn-helix domain-containing protein n=1 Tax=Streptomyces sp. NPDC052020 TaxID=3155677 RepID=UPI003444416F
MPRWRDLPDELDPQLREFAGQLRRLVDRSGLSVASVADRTGYGKTSWERYLDGRLLAPKGAIVALAEVTGTDPEHLTTEWELAERAWSRSEARRDGTLEAIRISQAGAALADPAAPEPGAKGGRAGRRGRDATATGPGATGPAGVAPRLPPVPPQPTAAESPDALSGGTRPGRSSGGTSGGTSGGSSGGMSGGSSGGNSWGVAGYRGPSPAAGRAAGGAPGGAGSAEGPDALSGGTRPGRSSDGTSGGTASGSSVGTSGGTASGSSAGTSGGSSGGNSWGVAGYRGPSPAAGRAAGGVPGGAGAAEGPGRGAPGVGAYGGPPRGAGRGGTTGSGTGGGGTTGGGKRLATALAGVAGSRLTAFLAGVVGALVVVAGAFFLLDGGDDADEGARSSSSPTVSTDPRLPPGVKCSGDQCTGKDAEAMGCSGELVTTARQVTVGTAVVEVRYSKICGAAWGRVTQAAQGDEVQVSAGGTRQTGAVTEAGDTLAYTPMVAVRKAGDAVACVTLASGQKGCTG